MIKKLLTGFNTVLFLFVFAAMISAQEVRAEKSDLEDDEIKNLKLVDIGSARPVKTENSIVKSDPNPGANVKKEAASEAPRGIVYISDGKTYVNQYAMIELTASASSVPVEKIFYGINGVNDTEYKGPFNIAKEGEYNINHHSVDRLGGKENMKVFTVFVDTTPPDVKVTANMPYIKGKLYVSNELVFTISAIDNMSGVKKIEYSTDGTSYNQYDRPFTVKTDKDIALTIRVSDNVGNVTDKFTGKATGKDGLEGDITENPVKLTADMKPPVVKINPDREPVKQGDRLVVTSDFKFSVTAEDEDSGVSKVMIKVDGKGDFQEYRNPVFFSTSGEHTIEAIAFDVVGNKSEPAVLKVFVNTTPPVSNFKIQAGE